MAEPAVPTSMQYLDRAVGSLRDAGLMPGRVDPAPINSLIEKISDWSRTRHRPSRALLAKLLCSMRSCASRSPIWWSAIATRT